MKNMFLKFGAFFTAISLIACSENVELRELSNLDSEANVVIKTLDFYYKGDHYVSEYSCLDDSIINIFDSKTRAIYWGLGENPNIITYVRPNGSIEYFNDKDEFKDIARIEETKVTETKSLPVVTRNGVFILYDDTNYKDRNVTISDYGTSGVTHLKYYKINGKEIGFNDKTSSFKLESEYSYDLYFEFWEDDNYGGKCLIVKLPPHGTFEEPNLKNVPLIGTSKSWNDRATSIKLNDIRTL